jgi:hypothetical protein
MREEIQKKKRKSQLSVLTTHSFRSKNRKFLKIMRFQYKKNLHFKEPEVSGKFQAKLKRLEI